MSSFNRGFTPELLTEQPEGQPAIGYEFEYEFPPIGTYSSEAGTINIHTYRVIGWERHTDTKGNTRISTRVEPISHRKRRPISVRFDVCNLGHTHQVYEYDGEPRRPDIIPEIWGFR